jgi:hypothetical protein
MASAAIHIVPDDSFDDWVVRGDIGKEFGHFPTREAARNLPRLAVAEVRPGRISISPESAAPQLSEIDGRQGRFRPPSRKCRHDPPERS